MRFSLLLFFFITFSCFYYSPEDAFYNTNFQKHFDKIAKSFCKFIDYREVILTDITDFQTLKPTKEGEFLTEFLRNSLTKECKVHLYQLELRKSLKMNNTGIITFSRKTENLKKSKIKAKYLITGTYSRTNTYVFIFIRLINLKTGKIVFSQSKKILYHIENPLTDDPFNI